MLSELALSSPLLSPLEALRLLTMNVQKGKRIPGLSRPTPMASSSRNGPWGLGLSRARETVTCWRHLAAACTAGGKGGASLLERWWGKGPRLSPECPLGDGCHSPRPGAAAVPGNEPNRGGWRAQVGAHLGGGTWDWQEGKETNISRALPATEDPVLISPLAWVHCLQSIAAEVQKG